MRLIKFASLTLVVGSLWAAQIPRPAPDLTIPLANGKQVKVSDYRGKVLVLGFILTTCPHCQRTTELLEPIYKELAPKGLAVVQAALNQNPNIPNFVSQFHVPWPVGAAGVLPAIDYIQWPKDRRPLVPFLVFIDRKGVIRAQYTGVDENFFNEQLQQHMRDEIERLLNEGAAAKHKSTHKHTS